MKNLKAPLPVYLSGGFYGDYKSLIINELGVDFNVFDPEREPQQIPGIYVGRDLTAIRNSKLVIAYQNKYPHLYGMAAEIGYAAALDIPVIYICTATRVDSFLSGLVRATFTDLVSAVKFIKERYSNG